MKPELLIFPFISVYRVTSGPYTTCQVCVDDFHRRREKQTLRRRLAFKFSAKRKDFEVVTSRMVECAERSRSQNWRLPEQCLLLFFSL